MEVSQVLAEGQLGEVGLERGLAGTGDKGCKEGVPVQLSELVVK